MCEFSYVSNGNVYGGPELSFVNLTLHTKYEKKKKKKKLTFKQN